MISAPTHAVALVSFPGSNDVEDAALALERMGAEPVYVWHTERSLPEGIAGVVLPGGFSYGDYLRCGAIARFAPVMEAVAAFAGAGGPVLGICNGFQILCEAGLLPGVLRCNRQQQFVCQDVTVRVESRASRFTAACPLGEELVMPVKHGEGNWYADPELVSRLERNGRIVLRYTTDVNGSVGRVAAVANERGNVMGLMPHPEHAVDPLLGPVGGTAIISALAPRAVAAPGS